MLLSHSPVIVKPGIPLIGFNAHIIYETSADPTVYQSVFVDPASTSLEIYFRAGQEFLSHYTVGSPLVFEPSGEPELMGVCAKFQVIVTDFIIGPDGYVEVRCRGKVPDLEVDGGSIDPEGVHWVLSPKGFPTMSGTYLSDLFTAVFHKLNLDASHPAKLVLKMDGERRMYFGPAKGLGAFIDSW